MVQFVDPYYWDWYWRPYWARPYYYPSYTLTTTTPIYGTTTSITYTSGNTTGQMVAANSNNISYTSSLGDVTLCSAGGTGMSGMAEHLPENNDEMKTEFKKNLDEESLVTINLRLVWKENKKYVPSKLKGYSNPIPEPV